MLEKGRGLPTSEAVQPKTTAANVDGSRSGKVPHCYGTAWGITTSNPHWG